jgi:hypothetical protein
LVDVGIDRAERQVIDPAAKGKVVDGLIRLGNSDELSLIQ